MTCSNLRPSMVQPLLHCLVFDVPLLTENTKMPLKVRTTSSPNSCDTVPTKVLFGVEKGSCLSSHICCNVVLYIISYCILFYIWLNLPLRTLLYAGLWNHFELFVFGSYWLTTMNTAGSTTVWLEAMEAWAVPLPKSFTCPDSCSGAPSDPWPGR